MAPPLLRTLFRPVLTADPASLPLLGVCPALAVTRTLEASLVLAATLTGVLVAASMIVSLIRHHVPPAIRLIIQITIVSSLVIIFDQLLLAYAYSLRGELSIFIGLIVTNCIVLGRVNGFAMHNPPLASGADALGNGAAFSLLLILVGSLRELLGAGTLLGYPLLPDLASGNRAPAIVLLAPGAFFIVGFLFWGLRSIRVHPGGRPHSGKLAAKVKFKP